MKRRMFSLVLALAGAVAACDSSTVSAPNVNDEIVGSWVSTGAGIAPGIVSTLKPRLVEANFEPNHTYAVVVTDSADVITVFSGTWTATGTAGSVRAVTLQQRSPASVTSRGIFQIADSTLTFEIVQGVTPVADVTPATVAGGFGSTSHGGVALGAFWVQTFARYQAPAATPCNPDDPTVTSKRPCTPEWNPAEPKR